MTLQRNWRSTFYANFLTVRWKFLYLFFYILIHLLLFFDSIQIWCCFPEFLWCCFHHFCCKSKRCYYLTLTGQLFMDRKHQKNVNNGTSNKCSHFVKMIPRVLQIIALSKPLPFTWTPPFHNTLLVPVQLIKSRYRATGVNLSYRNSVNTSKIPVNFHSSISTTNIYIQGVLVFNSI